MEGSVQNKERLWTKRRHAKQLKLEMAKPIYRWCGNPNSGHY